ncbi:MAG: hypothetical protein S4CHLAM102_09460 [Chlamydiia bacterium]|nr:hypothetical protein [Chlamydiia bacterium]
MAGAVVGFLRSVTGTSPTQRSPSPEEVRAERLSTIARELIESPVCDEHTVAGMLRPGYTSEDLTGLIQEVDKLFVLTLEQERTIDSKAVEVKATIEKLPSIPKQKMAEYADILDIISTPMESGDDKARLFRRAGEVESFERFIAFAEDCSDKSMRFPELDRIKKFVQVEKDQFAQEYCKLYRNVGAIEFHEFAQVVDLGEQIAKLIDAEPRILVEVREKQLQAYETRIDDMMGGLEAELKTMGQLGSRDLREDMKGRRTRLEPMLEKLPAGHPARLRVEAYDKKMDALMHAIAALSQKMKGADSQLKRQLAVLEITDFLANFHEGSFYSTSGIFRQNVSQSKKAAFNEAFKLGSESTEEQCLDAVLSLSAIDLSGIIKSGFSAPDQKTVEEAVALEEKMLEPSASQSEDEGRYRAMTSDLIKRVVANQRGEQALTATSLCVAWQGEPIWKGFHAELPPRSLNPMDEMNRARYLQTYGDVKSGNKIDSLEEVFRSGG